MGGGIDGGITVILCRDINSSRERLAGKIREDSRVQSARVLSLSTYRRSIRSRSLSLINPPPSHGTRLMFYFLSFQSRDTAWPRLIAVYI